eukprot:6462602-Amphidinium_carterae.1
MNGSIRPTVGNVAQQSGTKHVTCHRTLQCRRMDTACQFVWVLVWLTWFLLSWTCEELQKLYSQKLLPLEQ